MFIPTYISTRSFSEMASCGEMFDASFGRITSPGYPEGYSRGLHCIWSIKRPKEDHIYIYCNYFQLASGDEKDYLKVWHFNLEHQNNLGIHA